MNDEITKADADYLLPMVHDVQALTAAIGLMDDHPRGLQHIEHLKAMTDERLQTIQEYVERRING